MAAFGQLHREVAADGARADHANFHLVCFLINVTSIVTSMRKILV
jgi:hypothetical protein